MPITLNKAKIAAAKAKSKPDDEEDPYKTSGQNAVAFLQNNLGKEKLTEFADLYNTLIIDDFNGHPQGLSRFATDLESHISAYGYKAHADA